MTEADWAEWLQTARDNTAQYMSSLLNARESLLNTLGDYLDSVQEQVDAMDNIIEHQKKIAQSMRNIAELAGHANDTSFMNKMYAADQDAYKK